MNAGKTDYVNNILDLNLRNACFEGQLPNIKDIDHKSPTVRYITVKVGHEWAKVLIDTNNDCLDDSEEETNWTKLLF